MALTNLLFIYIILFSTKIFLLKVSSNLVGHGNNILCKSKIIQLDGKMSIVNKKEDLIKYKDLEDSCDVEIVDNDIIIWYKKQKIKQKGCSINLVTKNKGFIPLRFGISKSNGLSNCLVELKVAEGEGGLENFDAGNYNTMPFSFSLKDDEFEILKNGPQWENNKDCKLCINSNNKCLKQADYSIGWAINSNKKIFFAVLPIGEPKFFSCTKDNSKMKESYFDIEINNEGFKIIKEKDCNKNIQPPVCFKNKLVILRKPKEWEIIDENYKEEDNFKYLFTLHMLPLSAGFKRDFIMKTISNEEKLNETRCDIFIKLNKEHVRMLAPSSVSTYKTENKLKCDESKISYSSTKTFKISNTSFETNNLTVSTSTSEETINIFLIIGIILLVILIIILIICLLIWLFLIKKEEKEENTFVESKKTKTWTPRFVDKSNIYFSEEKQSLNNKTKKQSKTTTSTIKTAKTKTLSKHSSSSFSTKKQQKQSSSNKNKSSEKGQTSSQSIAKTGEIFSYKEPRPSTIKRVMDQKTIKNKN